MIKAITTCGYRIRQGDVIADVEHLESAQIEKDIVEISKITFPYVVVLTQDCDLLQDYHTRRPKSGTTQDKQLVSVLVAPLYNAEHVYSGTHLSELGLTMQTINRAKTPGQRLQSNQDPRYHYLKFPEGIPIVPSVIDFKHYFSVSADYLKALRTNNLICLIAPLYREDVSQRFASFLARIGLPY